MLTHVELRRRDRGLRSRHGREGGEGGTTSSGILSPWRAAPYRRSVGGARALAVKKVSASQALHRPHGVRNRPPAASSATLTPAVLQHVAQAAEAACIESTRGDLLLVPMRSPTRGLSTRS